MEYTIDDFTRTEDEMSKFGFTDPFLGTPFEDMDEVAVESVLEQMYSDEDGTELVEELILARQELSQGLVDYKRLMVD